MPSFSPARLLAPLALVAALVAVLVLVAGSMGGDDPQGPAEPAASTSSTSEREGGTSTSRTTTSTGAGEDDAEAGTETTPSKASYTVEVGDTFGTIAEETGVTVEELTELNPDADPQSLTVGQRLKLR